MILILSEEIPWNIVTRPCGETKRKEKIDAYF